MRLSRRELSGAVLLAGAALADQASAAPKTPKGPRPSPDPGYYTNVKGGEEIGMVLYPGLTALDLIGPHWFFHTMRGAKVHLVAATRDPVKCDREVVLSPTASFDEIPKNLDVLFVPGAGFGTMAAMQDDRLLDFLADRGARARYVTGICTGPLILGAAGLMKGYRATAHWNVRDAVLPAVGAIPVDERFVVDRNRITGAGVSAGLDFGLHMAALMRGVDNARLCQLLAEYDPQPPFDSGSPHKAWPESVSIVRNMLTDFTKKIIEIGRNRVNNA